MTNVSWGSYRNYEGPYFRGTQSFKKYAESVEEPNAKEKILRVFTATEGGRFDAINMYDRCIISVGLIQFCEAGIWAVSDMLGFTAEQAGLSEEFLAQLEKTGYIFTNQIRGKWRFYYRQEDGELNEVDTKTEQRRLFLGRSSGLRGSWDTDSRARAKAWASAVASVYQTPAACRAQVDYILPRVESFAMPAAKKVWSVRPTGDPWAEAGYAAFLSFAGNLPAVANRHLAKHIAATKHPAFSKEWTIGLIKELTFGPGIAIYPHRYEAIRPVLEEIYGVYLPDFASDLKAYEEKAPLIRVVDMQRMLKTLGCDPGKLDGIWGPKTKEALREFERKMNQVPDGIPDTNTINLLKDHYKGATEVKELVSEEAWRLVNEHIDRMILEALLCEEKERE